MCFKLCIIRGELKQQNALDFTITTIERRGREREREARRDCEIGQSIEGEKNNFSGINRKSFIPLFSNVF